LSDVLALLDYLVRNAANTLICPISHTL